MPSFDKFGGFNKMEQRLCRVTMLLSKRGKEQL